MRYGANGYIRSITRAGELGLHSSAAAPVSVGRGTRCWTQTRTGRSGAVLAKKWSPGSILLSGPSKRWSCSASSAVVGAERVAHRSLQAAQVAGTSGVAGADTARVGPGQRRWSTPLAKIVADAIEATGPISIASYMRQCLTNPEYGYYTTTRSRGSSGSQTEDTGGEVAAQREDQFGTRGDFITSPEISQIFGELVAIWFVSEWIAQGKPKTGVEFIELGPGRGTLMDDILRTITRFMALASAVDAVWLVEASETLREKQRDLLCGVSGKMKWDAGGWWECPSKYGRTPVRWVEDITMLPPDEQKEKMPFVVAHEFFDALPIHAFESVAPRPEDGGSVGGQSTLLDRDGKPMVRRPSSSRVPQWRELLVTPTKQKFSLNHTTTNTTRQEPDQVSEAEFQLVVAKASTPSSLVLPERRRYRPLKNHPGSRVEISPESSRHIETIARRIGGASKPPGSSSGAALIIDYGPADTVPINSLRGIRCHEIVSPFTSPGEVDISADVDFGALADAAISASENVEVHGPVGQGVFLSLLGIGERADRLVEDLPEGEHDQRGMIESGVRRLVDTGPTGMGGAYKVLAVVPEGGGQRRPVGFGGGVVG